MAVVRIRRGYNGIGHGGTVRESTQVIPRAVWAFHLDIQEAHQLAGLRFAPALIHRGLERPFSRRKGDALPSRDGTCGTDPVRPLFTDAVRKKVDDFKYEFSLVAGLARNGGAHLPIDAVLLARNFAFRQLSLQCVAPAADNVTVVRKGATSAIPIVFVIAGDPVEAKLVASLNRPGGNATGMTYVTSALAAKRVEIMHELVPAIKSVAALVQPSNGATEPFVRDLQAGAAARKASAAAQGTS